MLKDDFHMEKGGSMFLWNAFMYEGWNFKGLSPCDFHLIPKMKEPLRGIRFRTVPDSSGGRPLHSNYQHNRRC